RCKIRRGLSLDQHRSLYLKIPDLEPADNQLHILDPAQRFQQILVPLAIIDPDVQDFPHGDAQYGGNRAGKDGLESIRYSS
ncbi:MAG TPA: hypothetical protein PKX94_05500, partial [Opitutales bacterium]|nr:hypothetical protein [Opitutales bacterium]